MRIEIDQSGKIEQTGVATVIAFSDHVHRSIFISGKDKRELQELFRRSGKPRVFIYKLFAILVFLLVREHLKTIDSIVIDVEYPGWGHLIKDYLLREIRRVRPCFDPRSIAFLRIGKQSHAHRIAYAVNQKKHPSRPDRVVTAGEVLRYVVK